LLIFILLKLLIRVPRLNQTISLPELLLLAFWSQPLLNLMIVELMDVFGRERRCRLVRIDGSESRLNREFTFASIIRREKSQSRHPTFCGCIKLSLLKWFRTFDAAGEIRRSL